jgi:hypothetical protein
MKTITIPLAWLGACGLTVYPFIFVDPDLDEQETQAVLIHESIHYAQQRRWFVYGVGLGLLVRWMLYLVALPVWINPWRRRWETEAYSACGFDKYEIVEFLRERPYWLWGIKR